MVWKTGNVRSVELNRTVGIDLDFASRYWIFCLLEGLEGERRSGKRYGVGHE